MLLCIRWGHVFPVPHLKTQPFKTCHLNANLSAFFIWCFIVVNFCRKTIQKSHFCYIGTYLVGKRFRILCLVSILCFILSLIELKMFPFLLQPPGLTTTCVIFSKFWQLSWHVLCHVWRYEANLWAIDPLRTKPAARFLIPSNCNRNQKLLIKNRFWLSYNFRRAEFRGVVGAQSLVNPSRRFWKPPRYLFIAFLRMNFFENTIRRFWKLHHFFPKNWFLLHF